MINGIVIAAGIGGGYFFTGGRRRRGGAMSWPRYGGAAQAESSGAGASGVPFAADPTSVGPGGTPVTVQGVPRAVAYDVDNAPVSETISMPVAGLSLQRTFSLTGGILTASGAIETGRGMLMTLPKLKAFRDEVLAGLGVAANTWIGCVYGDNDTDALAWSIDQSGNKLYRPCFVGWDGEEVYPISECWRETRHTATHTASTSISSAMRTLELPEWLLGKKNKVGIEGRFTHTGATTTLRGSLNIAGTGQSAADYLGSLGPSAANSSVSIRMVITQLAAAQQIASLSSMMWGGGWGGVSASGLLTINEAGGGNITAGFKATLGDGAATATFHYGRISLER